MSKRFDFHIHSLLTEGELVPSEIARRCSVLGYEGIAITDHVDSSNLEHVLGCLVGACEELEDGFGLKVLSGVELTHVPPDSIERLAARARDLGAQVIIAHGETLVEPVMEGTNKAAITASEVDILAHPGLISLDDAKLAVEKGVFLELSARKGHSLSNGHVAKTALKAGADLLLNSDAHGPADLLSWEAAQGIAMGCGLTEKEAAAVLVDNPKKLLERI